MTSNGVTPDKDHAAAEAIEALTSFIDTSSLLDLANRFSATYGDLARTSTGHFLVTPVTALPTGKEEGKFICIDVGGTNLRVGFIELLGELAEPADGKVQDGENVFAKIKSSHEKNWPIGDHLKMDQAEDLFAWIGDCIAEVMRSALDDEAVQDGRGFELGDEVLLGITFSFPMA
jgi:hexokinase